MSKIAHNARVLKSLYGAKGVGVIGVTKAVCGDPGIAMTLVDNGIDILADSRTANIQKMRDAGVAAQFLLLRTPFLSEAEAKQRPVELGGRREGLEPVRYGDWEKKGLAIDF